ncbi:hypothetical protein GCM10010844_35870 [Deinococcus radiotolerans]|uniref:Uncharacterized protein n=1 Tax=Deinococcus radiotolerans TaxID=1309407 RepID=A0ABQ2FPD1_9DEIO|nr:hypothetical protein GCM10010844_35870 [Deinococcus radiotolerans]
MDCGMHAPAAHQHSSDHAQDRVAHFRFLLHPSHVPIRPVVGVPCAYDVKAKVKTYGTMVGNDRVALVDGCALPRVRRALNTPS